MPMRQAATSAPKRVPSAAAPITAPASATDRKYPGAVGSSDRARWSIKAVTSAAPSPSVSSTLAGAVFRLVRLKACSEKSSRKTRNAAVGEPSSAKNTGRSSCTAANSPQLRKARRARRYAGSSPP